MLRAIQLNISLVETRLVIRGAHSINLVKFLWHSFYFKIMLEKFTCRFEIGSALSKIFSRMNIHLWFNMRLHRRVCPLLFDLQHVCKIFPLGNRRRWFSISEGTLRPLTQILNDTDCRYQILNIQLPKVYNNNSAIIEPRRMLS